MKKNNISILIADDDKYFRYAVSKIVSQFGLVTEVESSQEAMAILQNNHFDIALIDMQMEENESGLIVLAAAKKKKIHSIILSSYNDDKVTEKSYLGGCDHFLVKNHYRKNLEQYLNHYLKVVKNNPIRKFLEEEYLTQDETLIKQIKLLSEVSIKDKNLFITGETGVGKSAIASLIYKIDFDDKAPFIHLNCSAIPENLIESELFGHEKGAFTGAESSKKGKLELANGGILFLDEIATMPLGMQKKLLKALDDKSFYPVGSNNLVKAEFTLISATCENLFDLIASGLFRKDLYYRISGVNIHIPALRERVNDISLLSKHFIENLPRRIVLKDCAKEILHSYSWPGNIRELKTVIEALSLTPNGIIDKQDIALILNTSVIRTRASDSELLTDYQKNFIYQNGLRAYFGAIEKVIVQEVMNKYNGKVTKALKDLKISASAFYRIWDQLQIK